MVSESKFRAMVVALAIQVAAFAAVGAETSRPGDPLRLDLAPIVERELADGKSVLDASLVAFDTLIALTNANPGVPVVLDSSTVPSTPDGSSPAWNAVRAIRRLVDGERIFWQSVTNRHDYLYVTPDQRAENAVAPVAAYPDARFTLMEKGEYYWANRVRVQSEEVKRLQGKTVDIVFVGDSQTHCMEGRWGNRRYPFPSVIAATNGLTTLNLGVGGDRTEHALWRVRNGQLDGYRARYVSILVGSNDGGARDPATNIVRAVSEIVKTVREKQPDATIILTALFPNRFKTEDPKEIKRCEIREGVRRLTDGKKILWLDVGDTLRGSDGRIKKEYCLDGVHLSDAGYAVWLGALRKMTGL